MSGGPNPGTVAADRREQGEERRRLTDYRIAIGDRVEVELLVAAGQSGARLVCGIAAAATPAALILDGDGDTTRVPWPAIALLRTTTTHPANQ